MNIDIKSIRSVYIEGIFKTEQYGDTIISSSSGFLVKKGNKIFLITNRHVVTGKNNLTSENLNEKKGALPNYLKVYLYNEIYKGKRIIDLFANESYIKLYINDEVIDNENLWIEHPIYKEKVDIVAIDISTICKNRCAAIEKIRKRKVKTSAYDFKDLASDNNNIRITNDVYIIGFPYGYSSTSADGYYPIWTRGSIASEYKKNLIIPIDAIQKGEKYNSLPAILVDSRTRSGQSGSPVIYINKNKSNIIGIYSGRTNKESDLGYVWKSKLIKEIIDSDK